MQVVACECANERINRFFRRIKGCGSALDTMPSGGVPAQGPQIGQNLPSVLLEGEAVVTVRRRCHWTSRERVSIHDGVRIREREWLDETTLTEYADS